jgi:hypothetical protein
VACLGTKHRIGHVSKNSTVELFSKFGHRNRIAQGKAAAMLDKKLVMAKKSFKRARSRGALDQLDTFLVALFSVWGTLLEELRQVQHCFRVEVVCSRNQAHHTLPVVYIEIGSMLQRFRKQKQNREGTLTHQYTFQTYSGVR